MICVWEYFKYMGGLVYAVTPFTNKSYIIELGDQSMNASESLVIPN